MKLYTEEEYNELLDEDAMARHGKNRFKEEDWTVNGNEI